MRRGHRTPSPAHGSTVSTEPTVAMACGSPRRSRQNPRFTPKSGAPRERGTARGPGAFPVNGKRGARTAFRGHPKRRSIAPHAVGEFFASPASQGSGMSGSDRSQFDRVVAASDFFNATLPSHGATPPRNGVPRARIGRRSAVTKGELPVCIARLHAMDLNDEIEFNGTKNSRLLISWSTPGQAGPKQRTSPKGLDGLRRVTQANWSEETPTRFSFRRTGQLPTRPGARGKWTVRAGGSRIPRAKPLDSVVRRSRRSRCSTDLLRRQQARTRAGGRRRPEADELEAAGAPVP